MVEKVSGKGVAREIEEIHPVACLIDMVMVEKEGIETIMEIAKLPERPKIVAVSSNPLCLEMAVDLGADASLKKTGVSTAPADHTFRVADSGSLNRGFCQRLEVCYCILTNHD